MLKTLDAPIPIDPSQVVVGLYIWLDIPWAEHPFLTSRLMVKTPKDVATIKASNATGRVYYYPSRSEVALPPAVVATVQQAETAAEVVEKNVLQQELQDLKKAKQDRLRQLQAAQARADKAWDEAARATKDALLNLTRSPKAAGEQLGLVSSQAASAVSMSDGILLQLLGGKKGKGPQFHALNTMTLCMLVGKPAGLSERELADLAMAALAHDVGKTQIPQHILQTSKRKKFEEDFYRQHVQFSIQFAAKSGAFSREALAMIADQHEAVDGSGWPTGKRDASKGARILAMVDHFDHLCTPEALDTEPMMPAEALAYMFRHEAAQFDPILLSMFIKLLGVYPPGTVVLLNDGSMALVVSPGPHSLQPRVLIYSPDMPKEEAPTLDLADEAELKISEAVRPSALSPEVRAWFNPQQRLSYFFSVSEGRA